MLNRADDDVPVVQGRLIVGVICAILIGAAPFGGDPGTPPAFAAAQAIASGEVAPGWLFVPVGGDSWLQPLAVYPAVVLLRAGVSPGVALLLPGMAGGICAIVLTYLLAARVAGRRGGLMAAALLASAPGFVAAVRAGDGSILMVPLVLAWTLSLLTYLERPLAWRLFVGACALGLSAYTQPGGVIAVPVYFILGAVALWRVRDTRAVAVSSIAIGLTLLPAAIWFWRFPDTYPDTFGRWLIHAAHVRSPWDGAIAATRWHVMARRVGAYWDYFSPTFLFGSGDLFALGMLVLIGLGLLWRNGVARVDEQFVVAGFFVAPAAAVLLDVERAGSLALLFLPFGAVLAALGAQSALGGRSVALRVTAIGLLILTLLWPGSPIARLAG